MQATDASEVMPTDDKEELDSMFDDDVNESEIFKK